MFIRTWLLATTTLAAFSTTALADEARTIPQIVITATRSPTDLNQIASAMTVITQEEIEKKNKPTIAELLKSVPGMNIVSSGGAGQSSRVFMRGTASNHVLVLQDGVKINDPSDPNDAFDFANLSTENIERIEVLRGAQSTLYGSQAIGGVINIISKKGGGAPHYNGFAEYGRYNSSRIGAGAQGEADGLSYGLQASNYHTDGISAMAKRFGGVEKDRTNISTVAGNFAHALSEKITAKLNLRYNRNDSQFDTPNAFSPRPNDDPDADNDSRQFNGRIAGEYAGMDGKWKQEIGLSYLQLNRSQVTEFYDSTIFDNNFGHQQYISWREKLEWLHHVTVIDKHSFTFGLEAESEHYKFNSSVPALSLGELNVDNHALFIDDQYSITPNFYVNAGIRADIYQAFGRKTTWKIAPGYNIPSTGTRFKASYGTGFQAPSLYALNDITYGNKNLNPESSKSYDAGFEQQLFKDIVTIGATLFRNDISQLLDTVDVDPPNGVYKYVNIGRARTQGVETSLQIIPSVDWKLSGSYTFTQADDRSADKRLKRRPKHVAHASAEWQYNQEGDIGLDVRHVGLLFDSNFAFAAANTKAFTTLDLYSNYKLTGSTTLYGRLDNLLDKRYEETYGYGSPGRGLYVGVKTAF